jgi:hypothetical protein
MMLISTSQVRTHHTVIDFSQGKFLEFIHAYTDGVKPGCHLRKCARIYALAEQLEKFLIFLQALPMLLLARKYGRIYASGIQA